MSWAEIRWEQRPGMGRVVVKRTTYDARLEAEGLTALGEAGAPVPAVHETSANELVLSHVSGPPRWEELGACLALTHRVSASLFGWHCDNVIGPLPQHNKRSPDWPDFFFERRLEPFFGHLPAGVTRGLRRSRESIGRLLDHDVAPSLVHGDLWAGNIVEGAWFIDPAVNFADRELDLAFSSLFGGIPDSFYQGYNDEWPLDDGWEERRPALQLYHLLVHVALFGGGYTKMVEDRARQYGWL